MKNYSSKIAKKGKLAYRTPRRFIYQKYLKIKKIKSEESHRKPFISF